MLNAFRHLRKVHIAVVVYQSGEAAVLNAFRHLRKVHDDILVRFKLDYLCSTPFGI